MDFQSAISVNSTGNSRSFTELTDRLAFANFSSPDIYIYIYIYIYMLTFVIFDEGFNNFLRTVIIKKYVESYKRH